MEVLLFFRGCSNLACFSILAFLATTTFIRFACAKDGMDLSKAQSHGITHCELKPVACAAICGTASPTCELAGNCACRKPRDENATSCTEPQGYEAKRCHSNLCLRRGKDGNPNSKPMVCTLAPELKLCTCFPRDDAL